MPSAIEFISEEIRKKATGDVRFTNLYTYFFELEVPAESVPELPSNKFLYPLVVGPEAYSISEPFTLNKEVGQGGSLYVEENGIVARTISLSGTTGWKPRPLGTQPSSLHARTPANRSFSRALRPTLGPDGFGHVSLSGHAHFMYLQDAVFRIYGDLKNDPATAEGTKMYFHNPRDDEHWLVAPQSFDLDRASSRRTLYPYSIELLVLGPISFIDLSSTAEKSLLERLHDFLAMISGAIDLAQGAIADLTALAAEIGHFIKNITVLLGQVQSLITAAKAFINGATDLIQTPFAVLKSLRDLVDEGLSVVSDLNEYGSTFVNFPETALQPLREIGDALDIFGLHPGAFARPAFLELEAVVNRESLTSSVGATGLEEAAAAPAPTSFAELEATGTSPRTGDIYRARADETMGLRSALQEYPGAFQISLGQGDTLSNLAMRYLGDARLWRHIAVVNGMKPPFINDQAAAGTDLSVVHAFSGVLGVGRKILIPSKTKPVQERNELAVLGARLEAPAEEQLLGVDWALEPVSDEPNAQVDIPVDVEAGSTDGKKVRGIACLTQGVTTRLNTEKKTDTLYPDLGVEPTIGAKGTVERKSIAQFRTMQAVLADPRIAAVRNLEATPLAANPDLVEVDMDAEVRGFAQGQGIRTVIG